MIVPNGLRYTSDHEWVLVTGDTARVGVTDYAQDALGDVVFVQLPTLNDTVKLGSSAGEVESTKSVSDIYAPLSGTVTAINDVLADSPQLVNSDPYGDGWMFELSIADTSELEQLLTAAAYKALTDS
jgi:glycine cleavage system H protein